MNNTTELPVRTLRCHVVGCANECIHAALEHGAHPETVDYLCERHIAELRPAATEWPWWQEMTSDECAQLIASNPTELK